MATPDYPVFEGDGGLNTPKRPVAATDLGGLYKVDDIGWEPNPDKQVTANDVLQWEMCIERIGRMIPVLRIDVDVQAGISNVPAHVVCVNDSVTTASITTTELSTGKYRISWPSGKLPPANSWPTVSNNSMYSNYLIPAVAAYTATSVDIDVRDYAAVVHGGKIGLAIQVF